MNLTIENEIFEENEMILYSNISTLFNDSLQHFSNNNNENVEEKNLLLDINKEVNLKAYMSTSKDNYKNSLFINKKRGRKKIKNINAIHNKFVTDNLLRKIQIHYINFIVSFINEVLQIFGYKQKLLFLNYKFKSNVNKNNINHLKNSSIGDILCTDISPKYSKNSPKYNNIIINIIKNNPIINSILSENYLHLFKNIYYKGKRIIDLKYYGLDTKIILSKKIEMYHDLLNKSYNSNSIKIDFYIKRMNECVAKTFLLNSIFVCN